MNQRRVMAEEAIAPEETGDACGQRVGVRGVKPVEEGESWGVGGGKRGAARRQKGSSICTAERPG
eukprot:CAMPEP_0183344124 /NCGR_PEP_ID=MMETSP0164_2-20130417/9881_1 /TAXON_ID=221442 /ORGANISM="Coccolithus pelagicus ssp braarudi, Strain PLY182g" /LENGTH=64 /DNA_ID=CAMNT_0025515081 /DNA_START=402 /DNA_END=593 /DNA_ORIENTATION=-